jgi:thiol-disulfide isomerase/thioredoxin
MRVFLAVFFLTGFVFPLFAEDINVAEQPWLVETAQIQSKGLPVPKRDQMLWADSVLYRDIKEVLGEPVIEVERWVNEPPKNLSGKFILAEVWATWCPPCRRSLALLEYYHKKYPKELSIVSICETDEKALKEMKGPTELKDIHVPLAVDTHRRFANSLGVYGIPHCVLIDPIFGKVVWEGMPTQIGYELSDEKLGKILANLKNPKVIERLPKESPVSFKACPPDPDKPNERPKKSTYSAGEE